MFLLALGATTALVLLGAVQGATEFLPVSSSGHLVIFGHWFGLESEGNLSREIALHFGTLVAVVIFCASDIRAMLGAGSAGMWRLVVGSSAVTAALAYPLKDVIASQLGGPVTAGWALLGTTVLLVFVAPQDDTRQTRSIHDGTWAHALLMGLFQSMALVPGISRAGSTIVGALVLGYHRPDAVRIAFLISIPAVGGAVLVDTFSGQTGELVLQPSMLLALLVACLVGLAALRFIRANVGPLSLRLFGVYTAAMGLAAILTA